MAKMRIESNTLVPAECSDSFGFESVRIVHRDSHHFLRIVNTFAAQVPRQIASKEQKSIELIQMLRYYFFLLALEVANEKTINFGQIADIVDFIVAVEDERVRVVLIGSVDNTKRMPFLAWFINARVEVGLDG